MNCLECKELLQKRLDGDHISNADALDQHLAHCVTCRDQHHAAMRLLDGLKKLPTPQLGGTFTHSMVAEILRDRRMRFERMRRRVFVTMALAASVLLMVTAAYFFIPRSVHNDPDPKKFVEVPKVDVPAKKPLEPEIKKDPVRGPVAVLTERLADKTRDHAKVMLAAANLDGVDKLPAVQELPMMDPGVQTVTRNARRAFDFFARELPMPELEETKE